MTWPASSTGRISRSARALRPIHTPTTMPSDITMAVATTVAASVAIASNHSPVPIRSARQTAAGDRHTQAAEYR